MKTWRWLLALAGVAVLTCEVECGLFRCGSSLDRINAKLHGQIVDFTHNHGADRRIWSSALCQKRDLYVYVPPGYDPQKKYPLAIFLHGATQDEQFFLQVIDRYDRAITAGKLPPSIIAAPDGHMKGEPCILKPATFFANTLAGNYEDWVMQDVWSFMHESFPIRKDREAHAMIGVSMGGSAAFAHAFKHKDKIKVAIGFVPALNLRWVDCCNNYWANFDPDCWGWLNEIRPNQVIGKPTPLCRFRFKQFFDPLIGRGPDAIDRLSKFNPIEMLDEYKVKDGELDLFVAYAGQDEFNIDAQVESFLYRAKERGIKVGVAHDPCGRHDTATGMRLTPAVLEWAGARLAAVLKETPPPK